MLDRQQEEAEILCAKLYRATETDMEARGPAQAAALHVEGRFHLDRRQVADAEAKFRQALDIAGDSTPVHRRFAAGILGLLLDEQAELLREGGKMIESEHLSAHAKELVGTIDWSLGRRVFTAG